MILPGISGIILAGGESRRMGALKPLIHYNGKPLIYWIFNALSPICTHMIIIANSGDFSALEASVFPDNYPGNGPAGGIEAGLSHCQTSLALITSCDTPNLPTDLFKHLVQKHDGFDVSIASHDDINEPLIGVFSQSLHFVFQQAVASGDPHPPRIIRQCKWQEVVINSELSFYRPDLFLNLNSPLDFKK